MFCVHFCFSSRAEVEEEEEYDEEAVAGEDDEEEEEEDEEEGEEEEEISEEEVGVPYSSICLYPAWLFMGSLGCQEY